MNGYEEKIKDCLFLEVCNAAGREEWGGLAHQQKENLMLVCRLSGHDEKFQRDCGLVTREQMEHWGNYKFEGRFNQGVVSLNLPQIGILARGDEEKFWQLLDQRLQLCFEALMCRHNALTFCLSRWEEKRFKQSAM